MRTSTQSLRAEWRGIGITINWVEEYFALDDGTYAVAHLEVIADNRAQLPISETGYRSHFTQKDAVNAKGGPVAYALAWLNHEAAKPEWAAREQAARQLSLF